MLSRYVLIVSIWKCTHCRQKAHLHIFYAWGCFLSLIVNKTQSTEKTEGRPIDEWKRALWAVKTALVFSALLWLSLVGTFTVWGKKGGGADSKRIPLLFPTWVYLKSSSSTGLLISFKTQECWLCGFWHTADATDDKYKLEWHFPIAFLVGGCFDQQCWGHGVWQVVVFRRSSKTFKYRSSCCWHVD